ncbi:carboxypeptidase-like regulatory domain-containing protein [Massilia sp. TSP1-1-2]|uniref:carboxypeptidase-like regulatory domain-containing protein n=1 Tax=unclassified Massilia TaxID=2609279 RepID=UPI003CF015A7
MEQDLTGSLQGRVLLKATGAPVDGATIVIVRGAGPFPDMAPLTGSDGHFSLDGLAAGEWVLGAYGVSGEQGQGRASVLPDSVAQIVIQVA